MTVYPELLTLKALVLIVTCLGVLSGVPPTWSFFCFFLMRCWVSIVALALSPEHPSSHYR